MSTVWQTAHRGASECLADIGHLFNRVALVFPCVLYTEKIIWFWPKVTPNKLKKCIIRKTIFFFTESSLMQNLSSLPYARSLNTPKKNYMRTNCRLVIFPELIFRWGFSRAFRTQNVEASKEQYFPLISIIFCFRY